MVPRLRPRVRPGRDFERATWNLVLLKLDGKTLRARRMELLELRDSYEQAIDGLAEATSDAGRERFALILDRLIPAFSRRLLFFDVFGLAVQDELRHRVVSLRNELRAAG